MATRMQESWSRLPGWATVGAGIIATVAPALHLLSLVLDPPDSFIASYDTARGDSWRFVCVHSGSRRAIARNLCCGTLAYRTNTQARYYGL